MVWLTLATAAGKGLIKNGQNRIQAKAINRARQRERAYIKQQYDIATKQNQDQFKLTQEAQELQRLNDYIGAKQQEAEQITAAATQGSSGSANPFVEFNTLGVLERMAEQNAIIDESQLSAFHAKADVDRIQNNAQNAGLQNVKPPSFGETITSELIGAGVEYGSNAAANSAQASALSKQRETPPPKTVGAV